MKPSAGGNTLAERIASLTPKQRAVYELKRRKLEQEKPAKPKIPKRQGPGPWPATTDQAALWFIQQFDPTTSAYNVGNGFRLTGELDVDLLQRCLREMAMRHEVLRTSFQEIDGRPHQIIAPTAEHVVDVTDLRHEEDPEAAAYPVLARLIKVPFDLGKGPLVRIPLVRMADDDYVMIGLMHHSVTDWWSYHLFFDELFRLYEARRLGRPSPLPHIPIQFGDWAAWRQEWLLSEEVKKQEDYWRRKLEGAPLVLELFGDRPRPPVQSSDGAREFVDMPRSVARAVRAMNIEANTSSFMTLLAATGVLLARYTGQLDMLLGTPTSFDRESEETRYMMGYLLNTLVLRIDLREDPSFRQLLEQVRTTCLEAFANREWPFRNLVEKLNPERDLSRMPVYQVEYLYVSAESPLAHEKRVEGADMPAFKISSFAIDRKTSPVDLQISFTEAAQDFHLLLEYKTDLFDPPTIQRFGSHLIRLFEVLEGNMEVPVSRLPLLREAERGQIVETWNQDRWPQAPEQPLHRFFELQAARTPEATAVLVPGQGELTYAELDAQATRLASALRHAGVGPETRVGLATSRSLEMMVGLYGILKAGAAYLPLDPAYPAARLEFMLEDGDVAVLLTEAKLEEKFHQATVPVICLDRPFDSAAPVPALAPAPDHPASSAAYVIYTSGTSGRPKGVVVSHRNAVNFCHWMSEFLSGEQPLVTLASTSLSFDISLIELIVPLISGGTVVLVENLLELPSLPTDLGLTMINTVPSALSGMLSLGEIPATVETILLAGEPLGRPLVQRLFKETKVERIVNGYGPTEATVYSHFHPVQRDGEGTVLIGRPLAATQAYALDRRMEPVPVGVPGELYLGGTGVSRGYHQRPGLTAERFLPDPFTAGRLYRTGDLVRCLEDGNFEFLGRVDQQVKIRGFRIELGEVEAALAALPGVQGAAATVREATEGGGESEKFIAGYLVAPADFELDTGKLRGLLAEHLPHYMVPTAFVRLDELPLLPNGKVNRRALPAAQEIGEATAYVAPRNDVEARLADIWMDVLGRDKVGVHSNFFDLGGHSLRATQVVSRLRESLGVEVSLRELFDAPTLADWALRIESASGGAEKPPLLRRSREEGSPLSFAQQRLWFLDRLIPSSNHYNMPSAVRLVGTLQVAALERTFEEIVRRHEMLRTTFEVVDGEPVQRIQRPTPHPLPIIDLSKLPPPMREREARTLTGQEAARPFDLEAGPLHRSTLLRLREDGGPEPGEHLLLLTLHHIVTDGWSMGVFFHEIATLYTALHSGQGAEVLDPLPVQYADFAVWQRSWLHGEVLEQSLQYWKEQLAGIADRPELPTDRPRPRVQTTLGRSCQRSVSAATTAALKELGREAQGSLYMTLLAAFAVLMERTTGQDDVVLGSPIANRQEAQLEGLIGFFVNSLVMRVRVCPRETFRDLLDAVRSTTLAAYQHQDVPFERLVDELSPERSLSHTPIFQVNFALQNAPMGQQSLPGLEILPVAGGEVRVRFDLEVHAFENGTEGLEVLWLYNQDLFDPWRIEQMARHYESLLGQVLEGSNQPLHTLRLFSSEERQMLLESWNPKPRSAVPETSLVQLFEAQVHNNPEAIALAFGEEMLSYEALNLQANGLAHRLIASGVQTDVLVGVCVPRSVEMVMTVLAIWKAGGAYLPLAANLPARRRQHMLEAGGVRHLVTDGEHRSLFESGVEHFVLHEAAVSDSDLQGNGEASNPGGASNSNQLAYVNFTSGSTGRPKGVLVPQAGVRRLVHNAAYASLDRSTRLLQLAPLDFDAATFEIWGTLLNGGCLVLMPTGQLSSEMVGEALTHHKIETVALTAGLFHQVVEHALPSLAGVRQVLAGGDVVSADHVRKVLQTHPRCQVVHCYGPTENTTFTSCHAGLADLTAADFAFGVPLGPPIEATRIYVLDAYLEPVPVGTPGELYTAGAGLARGYLGSPGLTAERFLPEPFVSASAAASPRGARMYRTGDRVRRRPDGTLDFLGRSDQQVKIRGFRIEPGEIEAALCENERVEEGLVTVLERKGQKQLLAYVLIRPDEVGQEVSEAQGDGISSPKGAEEAALGHRLQEGLRQVLPDYMVPTAVLVLSSWPLLPNGKVDRRALPVPDRQSRVGEEYLAPRGKVAQALAEIWQEVLHLDRVGEEDNFFALGGHSLMATQVMSRVRDSLGVEVPLRTLFDAPRLGSLARAVEKAQLRAGRRKPALASRERPPRIPLSYAQERLWFIDQLQEGASTEYNMLTALRLRGDLHLEALKQAIQAVVARHEVLRTRFVAVEGEPSQVIDPASTVPLLVTDLRALDEASRQAALAAAVQGEMERPFDLAEGPVLRVQLLKLRDGVPEEREHALLWTCHHIVSDGWSMGVLNREIVTFYEAFREGKERMAAVPTPLAVQYADFALWQRDWLDEQVIGRALDYWKTQLAGIPERIELPTDRPRPAQQTFSAQSCQMSLPEAEVTSLKALSQDNRATLFMTLLTAFAVLLERTTGQGDVVVGSPIANRQEAQLEDLIGFFINSLVLRMKVKQDSSFREILQEVRHTTLAAYQHQDLPFERLVEELSPLRSLSHSPIFQVMFALQNAPQGGQQLKGLEVSPLEVNDLSVLTDLEVHAFESENGGLEIFWLYSSDLFDRWRVEQLVRHYKTLLKALAASHASSSGGAVDLPLHQFDILDPAERKMLLADFNTTAWEEAPATLPRLFEAQAARTPEATAVVGFSICEEEEAEKELSYGELNARANRLAHHFIELGVGPESLVGIALPRCLEMVVTLLATVKAGAAFLPLDPEYPEARLHHMLREGGNPVVVSTEKLSTNLLETGETILLDSALWAALDRCSPENPEDGQRISPLRPENPAYVIYTSGSSGVPKGVVISHRALCNKIQSLNEFFGVTATTRYAAITSISFDPLLEQLLCPLCAGGATVLVADEMRTDARGFADYAARHGVNFLDCSPGLLEALLDGEIGPRLDTLMLGGDVFHTRLANRILASGVARRVFNLYGPTEACIDASAYELPKVTLNDPVSIGAPLPGYRLYVLDGALQPAPLGGPGELYIVGTGLARGYLGRPAFTAERFLPDPHTPAVTAGTSRQILGSRMYRTGDLARWSAEGTLQFLGRADQQVKIRGFRIEPGEIEVALCRHEMVADALAMVREEEGQKSLVGYVILHRRDGEEPPQGEELRSLLQGSLRRELPGYMIPSSILELSSWPLLPNGKVDRRALPNPSRQGASYRLPRTPEEQVLCQLFAEVLLPKGEVGQVGIDDNFFARGGHSLLAARLASRVASVLGVELPLRTLFEAPTVAELTGRLYAENSAASPFVPLLPLRTEGSSPPLFCLYAGGGVSWCYAGLVPELDAERPAYAIQERHIGEEGPFPVSMEAAAKEAIQEMRQVQPTGPYHLLGWSFGGLLAWAMACQLQKEGEEVAQLILLDSYFLGEELRRKAAQEPAEDLVQQLIEEWDLQEMAGEVHDFPSLLRVAKREGRIPEAFRALGLEPPEMERFLKHFSHCGQLIIGFSPGRFEGDVLFIEATERGGEFNGSVDDWRVHLSGELRVHQLSCHHMEMSHPENMAAVGRLLRS